MNRGRKPERKAAAAHRATARPAQLQPGPRLQPVELKPRTRSHQPALEGRYVYGVIESRLPLMFGKSSIGGLSEDVYTVHDGAVAAVVSRTPIFVFDPTRDNALAHEHVLETVMQSCSVLPMSFGTVFRSDEDVRELLRDIHEPLKHLLRQIEGKLEFGLKVTWDRDRILEELKREHDEIHRFHQELMRRRLQSAYFARVQLGRMMDKAMTELAAGYTREIFDGLGGRLLACRENKPIGDKMILNAAFLVHKEREADFDAVVDRLAHKFRDRLNFKLTGPWPPYNFVNVRLKLEEGKTG